ncbi:MAG: hypothetical protein IT531_10790 [Burkholderiales bacterium]|nr:hypothetical protein [Burkholderiales bacterium]
MLRASAVCERAGIPSASLVCEGFLTQAAAVTRGLGFTLPVAKVPGHPGAQDKDELRRNVLELTVEDVIANLTRAQDAAEDETEPGAHDLVFTGDFDQVNRHFVRQEWSDGLPIVPPTRAKVAEFLRFTDRDPNEVLGRILPDNREATPWSIAVNGVMAGCRPEYMPILVALIEAMVDPAYGVEHSGNTPGGETLIILNGPLIKTLRFNYTQGVIRDGFQPNTSIGRFWRLYLRNVAGFLLHKNDKATFGNTWRVVLAENEDVLEAIGWPTVAAEMGCDPRASAVTIARYTGGNLIASVSGSTPEQLLPYLADAVVRQISWQLMFTVGMGNGTLRPLVLLSPILAQTIARAGWSKADVRQYLYEHARIPASQFERILRDWNLKPIWNLSAEVAQGNAPGVFAESADPNRLVPLVNTPDNYMLAVSGDALRTNAYVFAHNGVLGYTVAKEVKLPARWAELIQEVD